MNISTKAVSLVENETRPLGVQLVNSRKTNKLSDPMDLVALAQQVQKADDFVRATAGSKLVTIAEQIRFLQEQAKKVLIEAKRDADLHHAACNMVKKPGTIYYLYERSSGQQYFSLLSPQEWGSSCPHEFVGAYKLEYDMSWTPFDDIARRDEELALIDKVLNAQTSITAAALTMSQNEPPMKKSASQLQIEEIRNQGSEMDS